MESNQQYQSLVESLRLLAAPFPVQKEVLPDFVVIDEEVIGTFGDAFLLLPQLIDQKKVGLKATASILRCFNEMEMLTRNKDLFTPEAFESHERWEKVRKMGRQALEDLGEETGKFDLNHLKWIE